MQKSKIKVQSLKKSFGSHIVLDNLSLDVKQGSSLVILGSSGTGKSVLIKTMIGLTMPDSGNVIIDDQYITSMSEQEKSVIMQKCGFLFQGGALFDSLNIQENITFFIKKSHKLSASEERELASDKLEAVGLSNKILKLYPVELSGGMQKRVALARAICGNPEILFFDEPTTGLDPIMSNVINELIIKLTNELNTTTITITHDIRSAMTISKELALIHQGKIVWQGLTSESEKSSDPYLYQFINGLTTGPITIT